MHVAALAAWAGAAFTYQVRVTRARARGPAAELETRRRHGWLVPCSHAALALGLVAGLLLMQRRGWNLGYPGWLGVKVGLTAFVVVPLEALHGWATYVWMRRGLKQTAQPPFSKDLARASAVEEMLAMLALPLLGLALPLMLWLSFAHPF